MPLYDYTCGNCGKVLEFIARREEDTRPCQPDAAASGEEPKAPSCTGTMVRNTIQTGSTFALKGTGWYKTDYKGR